MGAWLLKMLIQLALQFGMAWLAKKFPWLKPEEVALIEGHVNEARKSRRQIRRERRELCQGLFCPTDTVKE